MSTNLTARSAGHDRMRLIRPLPTTNRHESALDLIGNTPLLHIDAGGGRGYWAKLESANPGGIKDRAALHMVNRARDRGELESGAPIVESTSGTLGLGLALVAGALGHPLTVVTDPGPMRSSSAVQIYRDQYCKTAFSLPPRMIRFRSTSCRRRSCDRWMRTTPSEIVPP
jgi:hypothetical protein